MVWKQSGNIHLDLSSLIDCEWENEDGHLRAQLKDELLVPDAIICIYSYKCPKIFDNEQCTCKHNQLICINMSLCQHCENQNEIQDHFKTDLTDSYDKEWMIMNKQVKYTNNFCITLHFNVAYSFIKYHKILMMSLLGYKFL